MELKPRRLTALFRYLYLLRLGHFMQVYYAGRTSLKACHNRHIYQYKVMAEVGKTGLIFHRMVLWM